MEFAPNLLPEKLVMARQCGKAAYIFDMVTVPDEAAARREALRRRNGQFGESSHTPPDTQLQPWASLDDLHDLAADAKELHTAMSEALVGYIDAAMPADADFVNYAEHPTLNYLTIREACGEWGQELDLAGYAHINESLAALGDPYGDFDGDLVINSDDEYGWERGDGESYTPEREAAALDSYQRASTAWRDALNRQQTTAATTLRRQMGEQIEALEFEWDPVGKQLRVAAAIHHNGRTEAAGSDMGPWGACNEVAAYITHPDLSPLVRSELSGLYRLDAAG